MRVLVVDADSDSRRFLEKSLTQANFNVFGTASDYEGINFAKYYKYNIILLVFSVVSPDHNSCLNTLKKLRGDKVHTPIIVVSSVNDALVKRTALLEGADDYITKPYDLLELIARMHAVIRRSNGFSQSVIRYGPLTLNLLTKEVRINDIPLHLSKKEYLVLELLSLCKGTLVDKDMFLNHLYSGLNEPSQKIVDVIICKLRKKMAKIYSGSFIGTDWGRGYCLRWEENTQKSAICGE